ncbi:uncharacterized protein LOC135479199 isoform X2 [Liolophura sinensis]|uniref:uncharacterized protein LOC135479199 isoform X2 n=1 Tax=Liolophura sinensis TaxID=3198878 RepID=UPI003158436B
MLCVWSAILSSLFIDVSLASQWSARYTGYSTFPENEIWTQWYNTDKPTTYGGDDESLYSIRKRGWEVCPGYNILSAQCRRVGSTETFTESNLLQKVGLDTLYRPCTKGGLYCRNQDQPLGVKCQDYEVRFRCTSGSVTDEAVYTWVAVLAVVFLVIPIAWVVVINLKRRYCPAPEEERRDPVSATERGSSVTSETDPSLVDSPPTYEALFGGGSPVDLTFGSTSTLLNSETQLPNSVVNPYPVLSDEVFNNQPSTSENNADDTSGQNNNSSGNGSSSRRTRILPGMHLEVLSIMRRLSVGQPTPPPSYADAIIKLGLPFPTKDSN